MKGLDIKFKLKYKFLVIAIGIVLLLGLSMLIITKTVVTQKLVIEIQGKGIFMARHLSVMSANLVLTEQFLNLQILINEYKQEDTDMEYAFIQDLQGHVLAHTFNHGFPLELKKLNMPGAGQAYRIQSFVSDGMKIYDIAAPIMKGEAGSAHVGISESFIRESAADVARLIIGTIIGVLILGGGGALFFTAKITKPLSELVEVANAVGLGNFDKKADVRSEDEIGCLGAAFNKMVRDLKETTVSRDRLTVEVAERRRAEEEVTEKKLELEKKNIDIDENRKKLQGALTEISTLIETVIQAKDHNVRFNNPNVKKCYEIKNCKKENCACYGKEAMRCWKVAGTYCGGKVQGVFAQKFGNCSLCEVYKEATADPIYQIGENFNNMMHILETKSSELEMAYKELQETTVKLKQSNSELQEFANIASHDLQEPLRKISNFGERLKVKYADSLDDVGHDYINRMIRAASRMQMLLDALLDYSRIQTRVKPFTQTNLMTIAQEVLSDLEVHIEQAEAKVELRDLPTIDADPWQMRQLFQRLIGNALKFHKKDGPPVVKVSGVLIRNNGKDPNAPVSDKDSYEITIEDNGIGFDEKYATRIFGVFQCLHVQDEYEGSGIGLSVCKKIVERHGGSITAKSAPGQGASFIISLPVKQIKGEYANG